MYNILLVDDEVRTLEAVEKNINWRKCGIHRVFKATGMQMAIRFFQSEKIDIMICDIEMPNGSGLSLLEWLRTEKRTVNCIFATCHPEFDYMRKAMQLKSYDYILKPINYEELTRILYELVHKMENQDMARKGYLSPGDIDRSSLLEEEPLEVTPERNVELEVKKYIHDHLSDKLTVTDIAEALHFNPQYLMRAFKNKTELSILEYITQERLSVAKKILEDTDLPIKTIASMVGYSDYAYFTRVFGKETGVSPRKYREKRR